MCATKWQVIDSRNQTMRYLARNECDGILWMCRFSSSSFLCVKQFKRYSWRCDTIYISGKVCSSIDIVFLETLYTFGDFFFIHSFIYFWIWNNVFVFQKEDQFSLSGGFFFLAMRAYLAFEYNNGLSAAEDDLSKGYSWIPKLD